MKFPHYIFNPLHGMTLHDRLADFLRYRIVRKLPSLRITPPAQRAPYIYRSMVCEGNLELGLVSLASLASCAKAWPDLEMCVDESISAQEVCDFFGNHGLEVKVWTPLELLNRLDHCGESTLKRFSETYFWGRKTGFTFGTHEARSILYSDLDVLWFQDPWLGLKLDGLTTLLASEDRYYSYDQDYLKMISREHRELMLNSHPYCAGIYVVPTGYRLPQQVIDYINQSLSTKKPTLFYEAQCSIEQSSLGLAANLAGAGIPWELLPTCPDKALIDPRRHHRNRTGAHYASPVRRQFWRDAWPLIY